jgi:hypothetical protein
MAHDGSPVREVAEVVGVEIPAEVRHQEEHADSSSVNCNSNTGRDSATASQDNESTTADASDASRGYLFESSTVMLSSI